MRRAAAVLVALGGWFAAAAAPVARVEEQNVDGVYVVHGWFTVGGSLESAWEVLTDYGHLADFVPSMKHSEVIARRADGALVEQAGEGQALWFKRTFHVLLEVREEPLGRIDFRDTSGKDFSLYEGDWELTIEPTETRVDYRLRTRPKGGLPAVMVGPVLRSSLEQMLEQVRAEIARRGGVK